MASVGLAIVNASTAVDDCTSQAYDTLISVSTAASCAAIQGPWDGVNKVVQCHCESIPSIERCRLSDPDSVQVQQQLVNVGLENLSCSMLTSLKTLEQIDHTHWALSFTLTQASKTWQCRWPCCLVLGVGTDLIATVLVQQGAQAFIMHCQGGFHHYWVPAQRYGVARICCLC